MKNLDKLIITAFSGLLLMAGMACNNSEAASFQEIDLKKNEQLKERVFEQILNDEELFSDFIRKMRGNSQSMQWMREDRPIMQDFYGRNQMQDMMRRNPEMRQNMMRNMLRMMERDTNRMNPEMREQMLEHMRRMMARDTVMQNRMHQMMQGNNVMRKN